MAKKLAESALLRRGREHWQANRKNWHLPLKKHEKALAGLYLILSDYAENRFPPRFHDQNAVHEMERSYRESLPGLSVEKSAMEAMRKPFGVGKVSRRYFKDVLFILETFRNCGINPPSRLLELGCGCGWLAEFLALTGYEIVGTTLSDDDVRRAKTRMESIRAKGLPVSLQFRVAPMESVEEYVSDMKPFDAVFVYEALHHAYDWQSCIKSSYECLKPGGFLFLFNEPNLAHTAVSYRIARLSNTHEVGFRPSQVVKCLRGVGFRDVRHLKNRWHCYLRPLWLASRN